MTETLGPRWAVDWARRAGVVVAEHHDLLTDLDRAVGDGDHGENMARGFAAVTERMGAVEAGTVGEVLKAVATTLMSTVGGAAGPLYGTAFLRAAKAADAADGDLDGYACATLLEAAVAGIRTRGKAEPGEKTMVDAWAPAARDARRAAEDGRGPAEVLRAAAEAAEAGVAATEPMVATKGRASYLGQRTVGHRDPGAASTALILRAAVEAAG